MDHSDSASLCLSTLPFAVIGNASMITNLRGSMYAGRRSRRRSRIVVVRAGCRWFEICTGYNKSREQPHFPIFQNRKDNSVSNDREGTQVCLDISQLDSIAVELYLAINAALEKEQSIAKSSPIAGSIGSLTVLFEKVSGGKIWPREIARD